ncbi:lytic murein transglycosylase [Alkalilimnicola ehrlichii]|uniref:lytic murein transglycosylase n=1 Tax=Alkalilimnicola ehrlichii TaxID=351052 RepID=UPI003B9E4FA2
MLPRLVLRTTLPLLLAVPALLHAGDDFQRCVATLGDQAREAGLSESAIEAALADVTPLERVISSDRRQPEFVQTFWTYLDQRVTDRRVERGRALLDEHQDLLWRIHADYGVRPQYLLALWGMETNFGGYFGDVPVIDALATLACDTRRSAFFRTQVVEAIRIIDEGHMDRDGMVGSWAGAMGHTQFMPSTFTAYAVDYDGSGRIDLWNSLPDAFASSANYLRALGWRDGHRWGREVILPEGFDYALAAPEARRSVAAWRELGVQRTDGRLVPDSEIEAELLLPGGYRGPAFLVYDNFRKIMRWNASTSYALAVGILADRIAGTGDLKTRPAEPPEAMRIEAVKRLQETLNALGYEAGPVDGQPGRQTRKAVRAFQQDAGLPADGHPSPRVLQAAEARTGD